MVRYFKPVEVGVNFVTEEEKLLREWEDGGIVRKYLMKNKDSRKYFSFIDGPITANNPMAVHHAWGRTYKDLWQRYKNMRGYKERFQNGFDCQGLWVEVEVEKELGLKSKKEIENLVKGDKEKSLEEFVGLCKKRVKKYAKMQTEQSRRLGYFMDWDNSYYTMEEENNYMIWHFLKKCHEQGLIYKGKDAVPWCPRCGTAISQHEMLTETYEQMTHESIFLALPVRERGGEYLLVWTTTPWTIPANVAVAVGEELEYALVKTKDRNKYWVGKELADKIFGGREKKVIKVVQGKELVGVSYEGPYDHLEEVERVRKENSATFHRVVATDEMILPIEMEEGTGLVHMATGAGTEDFRLGKKLGLAVLPVIEEDANYLAGFGELAGKNAKKNPRLILDYLMEESGKGKNWVFKIEKHRHQYPTCWRCKTELVWRVVEEWYIAMDRPTLKFRGDKLLTYREAMKRATKKIKWIPKFGLKRELDWLDNMQDWLISKKRYWGLALPIWECEKCGSFEVIGGKEELKERAIEGWKEFRNNSPHRPWIDKVKIRCGKCGGLMKRIADVGNPWLDAGIVAFSTITENNKGAPLYLENRKEWERWFPANFITESFPGQFKNWFYAMIAMSTMLEGKEPFETVLGYATLLDEQGRAMHKSWGNAIEFNEGAGKIGVDVMRWMFVKQNPADNLLFGFRTADETRRKFHLKLWNVYNFFVTYANLNNWKPKGQIKITSERLSALDRWMMARLNQTVKAVTNYLDNYEAAGAAREMEQLVDDLSNWYVRRSRARLGAESKGEDREAFFECAYKVMTTLSKMLAPLTPFLAEMIYRNLTKEESVHLTEWPKADGEADEKLIAEMARARMIVESVHAERKLRGVAVRQPLAKAVVKAPFGAPEAELEKYLREEVNIKSIEFERGEKLEVKLALKITKELREEARARELVRKIQLARKKMGTSLAEKVKVRALWVPESEKLREEIRKRVGAVSIERGEFSVKRIK